MKIQKEGVMLGLKSGGVVCAYWFALHLGFWTINSVSAWKFLPFFNELSFRFALLALIFATIAVILGYLSYIGINL